MSALSRMLDPRAIAIAGLSDDDRKHGSRVLGHLRRLGFPGDIHGVNPGLPPIEGVAVYRSVAEIPEPPDLVVAAVPASALVDVIQECSGVGGVIAFAAGFGEAGPEGRSNQEELALVADRVGVRVLGPNSGGIIRASKALAASFLTCLDRPAAQTRTGPVAVVTQSGGTGSYLHNLAAARGGGLAVSVSTGNEADIGLGEAIEEVSALEECRVVLALVETVRDGPRFMEAVEGAHALGKRVVVCRLGTCRVGEALMASHTGAMAVPHKIMNGVLETLNVVVAETPAEGFDMASVLAAARPAAGPRAAIVTHSGGAAILLADLAGRVGLQLPSMSDRLAREVAPFLDHGAVGNPLDLGGIIGGPSRFAEAVEIVARSGEFDSVAAVSTPHPPAHTAERVDSLMSLEAEIPVVQLWMAGDQGAEGMARMRESGLPVTDEPRAAVRALASLQPPMAPARPGPRPIEETIEEWGLPLEIGELAQTPDGAVEAAGRMGYPVVVKAYAGNLLHKTESGGVALDLRTADEVERVSELVLRSVPDAAGVRVQRYRPGLEMIVGGLVDPVFGALVSLGHGGVLTELIGDVALAPAPIDEELAGGLIERLPRRELLDGFRGVSPADVDELARVVSIVSRGIAGPGVREVELNPLIWDGEGWVAVDWLVVRH